ncbi:MAG TPA: hypothetical protein VF475_02775 [Sphingobium sp.]
MNATASLPDRPARHGRIIRAQFTLKGGLRGQLLIKNISEGGLGARCDCPHVRVGDAISVDLPVVGEVAGTVQWVRDGYCGIQTAAQMDVDRLRFRPNTNLLSSPATFSVAERFQPVAKAYRPGFRRA